MENQDKPVSESEFRKIFVVQMQIMIDMLVTIGTLNYVLAGQGVLPEEELKLARPIVERLPKTVMLRKLADEILGSVSIHDILEKFEGTIQ